jgi:hypothetical protein
MDDCLDLTLIHLTTAEVIDGVTASRYSWVLVSHQGGVVALMHTFKRELSPAHLVCPRRHSV